MEKITSLMNVEFDSDLIVYDCNDKFIKTKISTNFQSKKIPEENTSTCKCLSLIMLDSVIRVSKMYYLQTFLEEC